MPFPIISLLNIMDVNVYFMQISWTSTQKYLFNDLGIEGLYQEEKKSGRQKFFNRVSCNYKGDTNTKTLFQNQHHMCLSNRLEKMELLNFSMYKEWF